MGIVIPPPRRFKKRYVFYGIVIAYLLMCQSCMTFRYSAEQTATFFRKAAVPFKDRMFIHKGHQLHYIETGPSDKPLLFFVHGSPGSWNAFKDYLKDPLLLRKYRMISIDRPGFGHSDFGDAEDLHTQAVLIRALLESVRNTAPVILIGHSLGGPLIFELDLMDPGVYKTLVILSGSVDPHVETPERWRPLIAKVPLRYLIPGAMRQSNDELWWLKQDLYTLESKLSNVSTATVIVHGDKDRLVPYTNVAFMKAALRQADTVRVVTLRDADHFIPWTHYESIRGLLLEL